MSGWTIVHTEASEGWGGQEIRILAEAEWLRDQGHTLYIVASEHAEIFQRATAKGFSTFPISFEKRNQLQDTYRLIGFFQRIRPHVVATHSSVDSWVGLSAAALLAVPLRIRYRHVSTPIAAAPQNTFLYRYLAHVTVTTSAAIADHVRERFYLTVDRVHNVPTGIRPPENVCPREEARIRLAKEIGVESGRRFIGQISVLRSWKGHSILMQAFETIASKFPDYDLIIVGKGPGEPHLLKERERLSSRDRIHFIGHRDEPWIYFRALDAATLASTGGEGVPQSILQAMAMGTPIIGTAVGGIPEVLGTEAQYGTVIEPHNVEQLTRAITQCLEKKQWAAERALRAEAYVKQQYGIDAMGKKITRILESYLG
jgi:glycosyltransferase involved in cell wall biosynthesis